jgi:RNA polymerase sigma-70 factor (ECF subfamily)
VEEQVLTEWATRFKAGDEGGFRSLVDALTRTLIATAYRYAGDWEVARDLTQETWIRVHEQIARYDAGRSFVSWLLAVHRNGCLDHLRRARVRPETATDPTELARLAGTDMPDPLVDLEREEFRQRIVAAARRLSDSQRRVFMRVDVEQGDQAAVAKELGIRPGTLRTTLHFARRRIAAVLNAMEEGT